MMKVYEALNWASSFLTDYGRETKVGELLLMHELAVSHAQLLANYHEVLTDEHFTRFQELVKAHATRGVPVQHLIGSEEFFGRRFRVNENVLIPRPETEELIQTALDRAKSFFAKYPYLTIADIGTGSGIIAITMQLELDGATVYATDISEAALEMAQENARELGADTVQFFQGNLLEPLIKRDIKVELLLSNPPYISLQDRETLQDVVVDYDPELALFGGEDGLDFYREMIPDLPKVLSERAMIGFEIGHGQGKAVAELLRDFYPDATISILLDINKKERMVFAEIERS